MAAEQRELREKSPKKRPMAVVGVLSAGRLTALYGIDLPSVDHDYR